MSNNTPLDLLFDYETRSRGHTVDLADKDDRREYWRAVSFRVGDTQLLVNEHDVLELLTMPDVTVVPGTKRWVLGIANIRGELLPIVDFSDFLSAQPVEMTKQTRILVIAYDDVRSGLIVDQVYGMRRFAVDERHAGTAEGVEASVVPVLSGHYVEDREVFHIMELEKLINETGFMQAAA